MLYTFKQKRDEIVRSFVKTLYFLSCWIICFENINDWVAGNPTFLITPQEEPPTFSVL